MREPGQSPADEPIVEPGASQAACSASDDDVRDTLAAELVEHLEARRVSPSGYLTPEQADARFAAGLVAVERRMNRGWPVSRKVGDVVRAPRPGDLDVLAALEEVDQQLRWAAAQYRREQRQRGGTAVIFWGGPAARTRPGVGAPAHGRAGLLHSLARGPVVEPVALGGRPAAHLSSRS